MVDPTVMKVSWMINLAQGPLVGEAEAAGIEEASEAVGNALQLALGDRFNVLHAKAVAEMHASFRAGATVFRANGVFVQLQIQ